MRVDIKSFESFDQGRGASDGELSIFVESIVLTPMELRHTFKVSDEVPPEALRDMTSKELSKFLLNKMTYRKEKLEHLDMIFHTFGLFDCSVSDKEMYEKRIKGLINTNRMQSRSIDRLTKEVHKYETETLWQMIKRWWKK